MHVSGSIQSDILIPQEDKDIGAEKYDEWALTNTYALVNAQSEYVDAGARFEFLEHPLPGFEKDIKGWGVPYFYVKGKYKWAELTLGDYYEQFGSGFILRTYEERSLGIDNSLRGGRLVVRPVKGVQLKALSGKQRRYWHHNDALVSGADLELSLDQWSKSLAESGTFITLGASYVNKHEKNDDDVMVTPTYKLKFPENVNAFDVRARYQKGNVNLLAEYAQKTQDPSFDNEYIYGKGYVAMLSGSYSKPGFSLLLQAKRSDNMSFRSERTMNGTSSFINHLPAFTMEHTYTLAALYPYATRPMGEWAYQAELAYTFKRKTALGGRYGTTVKLNFSHVHSMEKNMKVISVDYPDGVRMSYTGSDGYSSPFWAWGDDTYYQDINVQIDKKLTKDFKLNLMYMNQQYNKTAVEGEGGMIYSNIFVAEGKYRFNSKYTLRGELQYLTTGQDEGDWAFGLLELSMLPHWMFTVSDTWNCGETDIHYYQGSVTFNYKSHRIQAGYGRTRAGYNCSGGVCRYVPASKGVTVSYNYNF
ncbi:MAG: hypothetical protein IKN83_05165 [Bacteroidaceae bacterium]|nr:hypothetical protein [Bacteroidaceae bacterium]